MVSLTFENPEWFLQSYPCVTSWK